MGKINQNKAGLAFGGFLAVLHAAWSTMVGFGWAQPSLNFIFHLHFLNAPFTVRPFNLTTSVELVIVAALAGYAFAWVFAAIWNAVLRR